MANVKSFLRDLHFNETHYIENRASSPICSSLVNGVVFISFISQQANINHVNFSLLLPQTQWVVRVLNSDATLLATVNSSFVGISENRNPAIVDLGFNTNGLKVFP